MIFEFKQFFFDVTSDAGGAAMLTCSKSARRTYFGCLSTTLPSHGHGKLHCVDDEDYLNRLRKCNHARHVDKVMPKTIRYKPQSNHHKYDKCS